MLQQLFGSPDQKTRKKYAAQLEQINAWSAELEACDDTQLKSDFATHQAAAHDRGLSDPELHRVFALTREVARRTLQKRPYDTQVMAGLALYSGAIAEMKTGEGKTLASTMPVVARAISGKGVHVVTVNDYLAKRDAEWMGPVYRYIGLSVAVLQHDAAYVYEPQTVDDNIVRVDMSNFRAVSRQEAYQADIVYGTNSEFGFDYLRDNMVTRLQDRVQRGHVFCLIDEVDSILIDEARTPLIISGAPTDAPADYTTIARMVERLQLSKDYVVDEKLKTSTLTDEGITTLEQMFGVKNLYSDKDVRTIQHIEQALKAHALFRKDRDYVIKEGEIIIVDEFTGRLMYGRRYSEGLHQAIEAKERLQIKQENVTLATITIQNYFRMYQTLAGMTGTALTEKEEFHKIYGLDVVVVPTHRDVTRIDQPDMIYKTEEGKYKQIVEEIKRRHHKGQPVLVGTVSIEKNEYLALLLKQAGVPHNVLNAKQHEREAEIIAQAGKLGAVTVATNMAGRGVDIVLGGYPRDEKEEQKVKDVGGLFVLGTERHESRRIDNQLRGRSGRQGDPGESQFYLSTEDNLMRIFSSTSMRSMLDRLGLPEDVPIQNRMVARSIESAQKRVEGHNFDLRKHLLQYDDVVNKQREQLYRKRLEMLEAAETGEVARIQATLHELVRKYIQDLVTYHTTLDKEHAWDLESVYDQVSTLVRLSPEQRVSAEEVMKRSGSTVDIRTQLITDLQSIVIQRLSDIEAEQSSDQFMRAAASMYVQIIDMVWVDHLEALQALREGIGLRGYGQRDPLVEYQRDSFQMFQRLLRDIEHQVATTLFHLQPVSLVNTPARVTIQPTPQQSSSSEKIGRNDPCYCGSGKKYKHCHGSTA